MKNFLKDVLEEDLYPPMIQYFKKMNYSIELEIPIHRNRIDLIAYNQDKLIAVELKLLNWKRALRQATYYQLGADFVFLAVPLFRVYSILRKAEHYLKKDGIGLLVITEKNCEVRKIIEAKPSKKKICSINIKEIKRNHKMNLNKRKHFPF